MHRPTYTPVLCTGGGENFIFGAFSRSRSERGGNIGCFSASEASAIYFYWRCIHQGSSSLFSCQNIILTILKDVNLLLQNCGKLCTSNSLNSQKVPCCWELILMFDTLHSRHSSESNAGWPACGVVPKVHEDRVNFAVSHSFMCGSLTLRSCDTAWVWVPVCTKPNGV